MMAHRYSKRTESLPNSLSNAMFGNGQHNPEDNPNHLVYKKVRLRFIIIFQVLKNKINMEECLHYVYVYSR